MKKTRVVIGLGGRFHGQEMAQALLSAGHDVNLYTTFPQTRFPRLPKEIVHSSLLPEIEFRLLSRVGFQNLGGTLKARAFGKHLKKALTSLAEKPHLFIVWSGFGLEALRAHVAPIQVVERDSSHISHQIDVLKAAYEAWGQKFADHSAIEERELEEYELADRIIVLSQTSAETFVQHGVPREKIFVQNGGTDLTRFQPRAGTHAAGPLQVIYFGSISIRKGVPFLLEATQNFPKNALTLNLVGAIEPAMKRILKSYSHATVHPSMPHARLAPFLREHDVFVCPSLEDGFGFVVPQAMASGVVPIVSRAAGSCDLVADNENGFVVPAFNSDAIRDKLQLLVNDPNRLSLMRKNLKNLGQLSWENYSKNFRTWVDELIHPKHLGRSQMLEQTTERGTSL